MRSLKKAWIKEGRKRRSYFEISAVAKRNTDFEQKKVGDVEE